MSSHTDFRCFFSATAASRLIEVSRWETGRMQEEEPIRQHTPMCVHLKSRLKLLLLFLSVVLKAWEFITASADKAVFQTIDLDMGPLIKHKLGLHKTAYAEQSVDSLPTFVFSHHHRSFKTRYLWKLHIEWCECFQKKNNFDVQMFVVQIHVQETQNIM